MPSNEEGAQEKEASPSLAEAADIWMSPANTMWAILASVYSKLPTHRIMNK